MTKSALIKASAAAAALSSLAPLVARADDISSTTTDTASTAAGTAAAGGILGVVLIFWILFLAIALGFFIFWVVMLIDAFKRTNWQDEGQKNLWLIILIVSIFVGLAWLAALLYYFIIKRALDKGAAPQVAAQASQPTAPAQPATPEQDNQQK
ncbi:hypothetical protein HYX70_04660 [Candidatus Saccharibacteria bacterium]|nr:hypothetical protein [Candidatus Saccharibacteria bacterium]